MRLTSHEIATIKAAASEAFGDGVVVRLFGSRLHDHLRGGDIDLHLEIDAQRPDYRAESRFLGLIDDAVDGRKVDMIFTVRGMPRSPFERIAYRDGVAL